MYILCTLQVQMYEMVDFVMLESFTSHDFLSCFFSESNYKKEDFVHNSINLKNMINECMNF